MRLPFEWQVFKEHAWRNPFLPAAFLAAALALAGSLWCTVALLAGESAAGRLFSWLASSLRDVEGAAPAVAAAAAASVIRAAKHQTEQVAAAAAAGALQGEEVQLATDARPLCLWSTLLPVPSFCLSAAALAFLLGGELGAKRIASLAASALASLAWTLVGLLALVRMCRQWHQSSCLRFEEARDDACKEEEGGRFDVEVLAWMACQVETAAECGLISMALYWYATSAALSLVGALLAGIGLMQAKQQMEAKWQPQGGSGECRGLLRK